MATYDRERSTEPDEDEEANLPDEAVVVRGGVSTPDTLEKTAQVHHDERGEFAISARSLPVMSADDLAWVDPPLVQPRLRETTVGDLRAVGYDVVPDEPPPAHALIMLPPFPADDDYRTVSAAFGEPRANPAYREGPP